jgi:predicted MFS family arabinose efflux permease
MAWILGAVAGGIRSTASPALGLAQLPDRTGSMMAARTATLQIGYLLGGLLGGAALAWSGYAALGFILGAGMILAAVLVLRVTDPPEEEVAEPAVVAGSRGRS